MEARNSLSNSPRVLLVRRDVAIQVGGLLWKPPAAPDSPAPADEAGGEGPLTAA
jgi:hypothetical protein